MPVSKAVKEPHSTAAIILDVARDLFGSQGYDPTSVAEIASKVGIVEGAIYRHFPSKRDLLHQVIRSFYEPLIDSVEEGASAIENPGDRLRYLIARHLHAFTEDPVVCRLVISEARPMDDYYESAIADLNRRYTALVVATYSAGVAEGVFRVDLPATLVRDVIFGSIDHIAWGALSGHRTIDLDATTESLFMLLSSGISPQDKPHDNDGQLDRLEDAVTRLEDLADGGVQRTPPITSTQ